MFCCVVCNPLLWLRLRKWQRRSVSVSEGSQGAAGCVVEIIVANLIPSQTRHTKYIQTNGQVMLLSRNFLNILTCPHRRDNSCQHNSLPDTPSKYIETKVKLLSRNFLNILTCPHKQDHSCQLNPLLDPPFKIYSD